LGSVRFSEPRKTPPDLSQGFEVWGGPDPRTWGLPRVLGGLPPPKPPKPPKPRKVLFPRTPKNPKKGGFWGVQKRSNLRVLGATFRPKCRNSPSEIVGGFGLFSEYTKGVLGPPKNPLFWPFWGTPPKMAKNPLFGLLGQKGGYTPGDPPADPPIPSTQTARSRDGSSNGQVER
jgi:hypothetical protein